MKHFLLILLTFVVFSLEGSAVLPPDSTAISRLRSAAMSGDSAAQYRYALALERGLPGLPIDSIAADSLIERSAKAGYNPALNLLGFKYYRGEGRRRDVSLALDLIERAALNGDGKAANNLGWLLLQGEGVEHNPQKAVYWFESADKSGVPAASVQLADLLAAGEGVPRDSVRAVALYEKGIRGGVADAELKLLRLLRPDKLTSDAAAMTTAAEHYLDIGAPFVAYQYLLNAEQREDVPAGALRLLADMYALGRGAPYNHAESMKLYLRAARLGDPEARNVLAETLEIFPDALDDPQLGLPPDITDAERTAAHWR